MSILEQVAEEVDRAIAKHDRAAIGALEQELFVLAHKLRVARRYLTQQTFPIGAGHARLASSK